MKDKRVRLSWPEWVEYCAEHGIDPREQCEDGHDLGGGDSYEVVCYDVPEEDIDTMAIAKRLAKKYNRNILDPKRQVDKNGR